MTNDDIETSAIFRVTGECYFWQFSMFDADPNGTAFIDYPGVGPEHAWLKDTGRAEYVVADDDEALEAFKELTKVEGIMPALETAHALAYVRKLAPTMKKNLNIVVNVSGRGDKDINTVAAIEGIEL